MSSRGVVTYLKSPGLTLRGENGGSRHSSAVCELSAQPPRPRLTERLTNFPVLSLPCSRRTQDRPEALGRLLRRTTRNYRSNSAVQNPAIGLEIAPDQ